MIPATLEQSALSAAVAALIGKSLAEIPAHAFDRLALVAIYDKLIALERTLPTRKGKWFGK